MSTANVLYLNSKQIIAVRNKTVVIISTRTNTVDKTFDCEEEISVVSIDKDRNHLAAGSVTGRVYLFSMDGEHLVTFSGHRTPIRLLEFSNDGGLLASVANEPEIVVWDIVSEVGVCRFRGHLNVIRGIVFDGDIVVSAGDDGLVKVWDMEIQQCRQTLVGHRAAIKSLYMVEESYYITCTIDGTIRVIQRINDGDNILKIIGQGVLSVNGYVEGIAMYKTFMGLKMNSGTIAVAELITSEDRKQSRKRKKRLEGGEFLLSDYITLRHAMKISSAITSIDVQDEGLVVVSMVNSWKEYRYVEWNPVPLQEHGLPDTRVVLVADDDMKIAAIGEELCSLWTPTGAISGTIECSKGNAATFLPGGRFIALGTVGGSIEIIDTAAATVIGSMKAHDAEVTCIQPWKGGDMLGLVTGGKDHQLKLWSVDVMTAEDGKKCVTLTLENEWKMDESIVNVAISKEVIAVALLDNTVKVYKLPGMQFFLSLYGHNLPVTSLDISDDNQIIVTGSVDKTIKVWGLQFGECMKTFKEHEDTVTGIACIPRTHYFMSTSKDATLRYWDADKQIQIKIFKEHTMPITSLACSKYGDYCVTASLDHSFIVWMRNKQQVFVQEEENKQLTAHFNDEEMKQLDFIDRNAPDRLETTDATRKNIDTIKNAEDLMAVLDLVTKEDIAIKGYEKELEEWTATQQGDKPKPPEPSIELCGDTPSDHLLKLVSKITPSDMQQTLLMLPTSNAILLLQWVVDWLERRKRVLMCVNIGSFLCKVHYSYFVACKDVSLIQLLSRMAALSKQRIEELRLTTATNLEVLKVIDIQLNENYN